MILFKPEHVPMILEGRKTQTRRIGKKRWNVGSAHKAKTTLFGDSFAWLVILSVRQEVLGEISLADAVKEGYGSISEYIDAFCTINKTPRCSAVLNQLVWVIEFRRVKKLPS